jgi:Uncharacterized protein conserved in bacteria
MVQRNNYNEASQPHRERAKRVEELVQEILRDAMVDYHSVTSRVKTEQSAKAKIEQSPDKYGDFRDLHDLLGVRVITHLATQVDVAEKALKAAFDVDEDRSTDKASVLSDDEFGYRSVHLIVKLRQDRAKLPEWRNFADIYFEVQVRSILQHAWAEIEHDLGYKASVAVPREIRRRFARLAGLLELADDEFDKLAGDADRHATKVDAAIRGGKDVPVERDSVVALVSTDGPVRSADVAIARRTNRKLAPDTSQIYATTRAEELRSVGLESIDEVTAVMEDQWERVAEFASDWLLEDWEDGDADDPLSPGISLYYLYIHLRMMEEGHSRNAMPSSFPGVEGDMSYADYLERKTSRRSKFESIHDAAFSDSDDPSKATDR